jgi:NADH-quinone oxidoreductase subunit L
VVSNFLKPVVGEVTWGESPAELPLTLATVVLAVVFFLLPYFFYVAPRRWPTWSRALPWAQALLEHKYYVDEIYDALFVRTTDAIASGGDKAIEIPLLDGAGTAIGGAASGTATRFSLLENGYFRSYMIVFVIGALIAVLIMLTGL